MQPINLICKSPYYYIVDTKEYIGRVCQLFAKEIMLIVMFIWYPRYETCKYEAFLNM